MGDHGLNEQVATHALFTPSVVDEGTRETREVVEEDSAVPRPFVSTCGSPCYGSVDRMPSWIHLDFLVGLMEGFGIAQSSGCEQEQEVLRTVSELLKTAVDYDHGWVERSWIRGSDAVFHVTLRLHAPPGLEDAAVAAVRKRAAELRRVTSSHGGTQTAIGIIGLGRSVSAVFGAFASLKFGGAPKGRSLWQQFSELARRKREEERRARELFAAVFVGLRELVWASQCVQRAWRARLAAREVIVPTVGAALEAMRVSDAAPFEVAVTRVSRRRGYGARGGRRHRRGSGSVVVGAQVERRSRGGGRQRRRLRAKRAKWAALIGGGPQSAKCADANVATLRFTMSAIASGIRVERSDQPDCERVWAKATSVLPGRVLGDQEGGPVEVGYLL